MRDERLYENLKLWLPGATDCDGPNGIPRIAPANLPLLEEWLPVNYAASTRLHKGLGLQMYVHDYQLQRLWNNPKAYARIVTDVGCVLTPDYSLYIDVPLPLNLYNHYRKHWLGAWWQRQGATVIPTICWADESSFAWCFDGEPEGAAVSVSSVGTQRYQDSKRAFLLGYDAMLERLHPDTVLFFGNIPQGARGNICPASAFYKSVERQRKAKWEAEAQAQG